MAQQGDTDEIEIELAPTEETQNGGQQDQAEPISSSSKRTERRGSIHPVDDQWLQGFKDKLNDDQYEELVDHMQHANRKELVAALQDTMSSAQRMTLYRALQTDEERCKYFPYLRSSEVALLFRELSLDRIRAIMESLDQEQRDDLIQELPQVTVEQISSLLSEAELEAVKFHDTYPKDSIGRYMRPVSANPVLTRGTSLADALERFSKELRSNTSKVVLVSVTDEDGRLLGIIDFSKLFGMMGDTSNAESAVVDDAMIESEYNISPDQPAESVLAIMKNRKIQVAPVVDESGGLVGLVNSQTLLALYERQALHNFQIFSSLEPLDYSFSKSSPFLLLRKRIFWLLLLVVVNVGTAFIIGEFEEELEANIVLASFIPLVADLGGNTGSQSAAIMIQSLASKDLVLGDFLPALRKESCVGIFAAAILGMAGWLLGFVRDSTDIGFVLGLSVVVVVLASTFFGFILPFICGMVKVDAATVSGPMVTTLMDMIGVSVYFAFAVAILGSGSGD